MGLLQWMAGLASERGRAMAQYRLGMAKARKGDYRGAIADYTAVIESPNVPIDVKGMATYNRALAYAAIEENQ